MDITALRIKYTKIKQEQTQAQVEAQEQQQNNKNLNKNDLLLQTTDKLTSNVALWNKLEK